MRVIARGASSGEADDSMDLDDSGSVFGSSGGIGTRSAGRGHVVDSGSDDDFSKQLDFENDSSSNNG